MRLFVLQQPKRKKEKGKKKMENKKTENKKTENQIKLGQRCSKCVYYSFPLRRCRFGKINPRTIKGGVSAAQIMGISCICLLSLLYPKIVSKLLETQREA